MKITEKVVVARNAELKPVDIGGQLCMLNAETGKYIVLNEVGTRIWDLTSEPISVGDIIAMLTIEFDITADDCREQVLPYLEKMKKERLLRVIKP